MRNTRWISLALLLAGLLYPVTAQAVNCYTVAGCAVWLKADAITGLSDGDDVGTWADSSGNSLDATQGTAANKPHYKTNIQNSLPIVRFDRTAAQYLAGSSGTWQTVFVVTKVGSNDGYNQLWTAPAGGTAGASTLRWEWTYKYSGVADANSGCWSYSNTTQFFVNGVNTQDYPNGAFHIVSAERSSTVTNTFEVGGEYNGGSRTWDGDIGEVVVYNTTLSTTDRQTVEGYLAWKWGIQSSLPAGHPWKACAPPGPCASPKRTILNSLLHMVSPPGPTENR